MQQEKVISTQLAKLKDASAAIRKLSSNLDKVTVNLKATKAANKKLEALVKELVEAET